MLRLLTKTAIGVGLLVATTSFAQMSHTHPAPSLAATKVSELDQQNTNFIRAAATGGMAEVTLSKMAEKSENPGVKHFTEKMARDHTAANAELTTTATEAGVEIPKTLDRDHQKPTTGYRVCTGRHSTSNTCGSWSTITTKR